MAIFQTHNHVFLPVAGATLAMGHWGSRVNYFLVFDLRMSFEKLELRPSLALTAVAQKLCPDLLVFFRSSHDVASTSGTPVLLGGSWAVVTGQYCNAHASRCYTTQANRPCNDKVGATALSSICQG